MKFLLVLFTLVALAAGYEFGEKLDAYDRSLSSNVVDWIEYQKGEMPCGFPGLGLGPLSPARLSHRQIALSTDNFDLEGEIRDFILYGLDNFDVVEFKINAITSKVTFRFRWHKVHFDTLYDVLVRKNSGIKLKLQRGGGAKIAISDFTIWGTAKYKLLGKLRVKELKTYATVGNVQSEIEGLSDIGIINRKINEIIAEWLMLAVNDNTDNLADITNELVVPLLNDMIGDRTLKDIISAVGGSGGDGEKPPKQPCVPPQLF